MKSSAGSLRRTDKKCCAIFPGALGDFVCFLPALHELQKVFDVDLFARTEFADLVPETTRVQSIERFEVARLFAAEAENDQRVKRFFGGYSEAYSWHGSRSREFVRSLTSLLSEAARIFPFYPAESGIHQADYFLSCISDPGQRATARVEVQSKARAWADDYWGRNRLGGKAVLGIAPGSGAPEKNWPAEYFVEVARWWREKLRGVVVLFLGPAEEMRGDLKTLRECCLSAVNLPLGCLAALLCRPDIYLGNDSGVSHLAAAAGASTVALFGPTAVSEWAPRGPCVTVITHPLECSPCGRSAMKTCGHRSCLRSLHPRDVIVRIETLLGFANLTRGEAATRV